MIAFSELPDPRSLSDRVILENMKRTGGFMIDGHLNIPKSGSERPLNFVDRVRREYGAWYAEQEYQEASKARAAKASSGEADNGPKIIVPASAQVVQASEASLEELLKTQVTSLRERGQACYAEYERLEEQARIEYDRYTSICREFKSAERFLKELVGESDTPKDASKVGGDLPAQVGQRKQRSRRRVGTTDSPSNGESLSTGDDADYSSRTGGTETGGTSDARVTEGLRNL